MLDRIQKVVMQMNIVPGPHNGFWIKDGEKVIWWCSTLEQAEARLKELQ